MLQNTVCEDGFRCLAEALIVLCKAHFLTKRVHDVDLLSLDSQSVAEVYVGSLIMKAYL